MLIFNQDTPFELEDKVDKDSMLYYTFYLKPPVWSGGLEYIKGDIVRPSVPTGYHYLVISSGISGAIEPTWSTTSSSKTLDNTVIFKAIDNKSYLSSSGTLNTVTSSFEASDSIRIIDSYFTSEGVAGVQIGPVPSTIKKVTLTLKFYVDNGNPLEDYDERSILIRIGER